MDRNEYEEILDGAIQNEIDAHNFYLKVSEKVENSYLKKMFSSFAVEELKHRKILEGFKADSSAEIHFESVPDYHVAETVDKPSPSLDMTPSEAIALAMKNEEEAMKQYSELANTCEDADMKKVFLELATMEREHKHKMEQAFVDIGYPEVW